MATWLWLEEKGYPNVVVKMVDLSYALVNAVADEAVLCLKCLESNSLPLLLNGGIPLNARIMEKNICLEVFHHNKFSAISGIKNFLTTVCARIFTDILQRVLATTSSAQTAPNQPLIIPGFPHPLFPIYMFLPRCRHWIRKQNLRIIGHGRSEFQSLITTYIDYNAVGGLL
ncbi:uncharacterized protein LOC110603317 [Manihot esculenta]|uniref:uncharacterized protein LOC110603317 n=1 Tax=Manihot esculenta TaxID=3983 RepID=UPI000B5D7106|nr:uncharacterized protein LOC110603317 [Manihot esculenta]